MSSGYEVAQGGDGLLVLEVFLDDVEAGVAAQRCVN